MSLEILFADMEQQTVPSDAVGTLERRILTQSACDLFIGVHKPENTRSLRVRFSSAVTQQSIQVPRFRGLELRRHQVTENGSSYLTVVLRVGNPAFAGVFTSLAEDVVRHVSQMYEEGQAATAFFSRLIQWQRLLERQGTDGLGPEAQRGLYGELWFLREHIIPTLPLAQAIRAWTAPEGTAKDFQFTGCAVEVKTTIARQHQHLQIASERQLDDRGLNALFLCHLSLDPTQGTGETLLDAVTSLRRLTAADPGAAQLLEDRLLDAGYLDIHSDSYATVGYLLRSVNVYRVQDGFPRIVEHDLVPGVGDVRYSISAAECQHYKASAEDLKVFIGG